jgi:cytochrome c peroxidase
MTRAALLLAISALLCGAGIVRSQTITEPSARMALTPLPLPEPGDERKIALGRALFSDSRLSGSLRLSCQSCHDLGSNGASARRLDAGDSGRLMPFNTPTVFNSGFNFRLGWQGRATSLRELTLGTLRNGHLMSGHGLAGSRLAADPQMAARFRSIYHAAPGEANVADALSAFVATLATPDSAFDRWMGGDRSAMTAQQVRGYRRFTALGCASCHQGRNVGGNLSQRRGIFHPLGERDPQVLRVPSLRNVAVTAPYFHDGSVQQLPEAIRQMARAQLDLTIADRDVTDIAAFLGALTGTWQGHRLHAPNGHAR